MNSICHSRAEQQLCPSRKWLHSKPNWNFGVTSEHWDFWHVSNITRDFERDWARAFFLPAGAWSPVSAFKRLWAFLPNHKRLLNWEGRNGSVTHLWISQVNRRGSTAWDRKWRWLKSMSETTSNLYTFWVKVKVEYPRMPQNHWKACFRFQHPVFVKQGLLQWQQPKRD